MNRPVLLVNPPRTSFQAYIPPNYSDPHEPLGLLFIAGYLRVRGLEVEAIDFLNDSVAKVGDYYWQGTGEAEIEAEFRRRRPRVVGITSMFSVHCHGVHRVAAAAKRAVPDALVVVGGAHPSGAPQIVVADPNIDLVVIGEGEETFHEILQKHARGESLRDIPGVACTDSSGAYHEAEPRAFMDLWGHPGPARDLLDTNRYIGTRFSRQHGMHPRRLPAYTSRGCPYNCIFCCVHSVWRHSYRTRSPAAVLNEIEGLVTKYNIGEVLFWDDNLAANPDHFNAILDGLIERRLRIRWSTPYGIAIWLLNERLIDKCRQSGCYKFLFGIDTGSKNTQKFIRKTHIDLERTKQLIQHCHRAGIWTHSSFIIGFPFETREDILETIHYASDCGLDGATFKIATPFPGCDLYKVYEEHGLLPENVKSAQVDRWIGDISRSTRSTRYLTADELNSLLAFACAEFRRQRRRRFLNPFYVARKVRNWQDLRYILRLAPLGFRQYVMPAHDAHRVADHPAILIPPGAAEEGLADMTKGTGAQPDDRGEHDDITLHTHGSSPLHGCVGGCPFVPSAVDHRRMTQAGLDS
jgi:anaerobic magnesium-protoporphyrin IX monomethyl ester cyclase